MPECTLDAGCHRVPLLFCRVDSGCHGCRCSAEFVLWIQGDIGCRCCHASSSECVCVCAVLSSRGSEIYFLQPTVTALSGTTPLRPASTTPAPGARLRRAKCGAPNAPALWIQGGASKWRRHGYCVDQGAHATGCNVATALCSVLALEPACFHRVPLS